MSHIFQCGEHTALVSYLYDECEPAERPVIDAHVTGCAACAAELAALESARLQLASWTPPEAGASFQIVRAKASGPRPQPAKAVGLRPRAYARAVAWSSRPLPVWAQAAAACLIFATGLWLGVMRGSMPGGSPEPATDGAAAPAATGAGSGSELAALERRLRAEMTQLRTAAVPANAAAPQGVSAAQLLAQVRALIEESEQRQQRELALRTAQVVRDFDSQRRVDLAQIQRSFGQIEGLTGAEVREQWQMLDYLMRVSEQR